MFIACSVVVWSNFEDAQEAALAFAPNRAVPSSKHLLLPTKGANFVTEMATKPSPRISSLLQALLSIHHQQPRIIASPPIVPGTTSAPGGGGNPGPGASRRASVAISELVSIPVGVSRWRRVGRKLVGLLFTPWRRDRICGWSSRFHHCQPKTPVVAGWSAYAD